MQGSPCSGGDMHIPSMPFTIVVLAPFNSCDEAAWKEDPVVIDATTFNQVMETLNPMFSISVPRDICPEGRLDVTCSKMKDFHPDGLVQHNRYLMNLLDARKFLKEAEQKGMTSDEILSGLKQWPDLPPLSIPDKPGPTERTPSSAVDNILKMVALPQDSAAPAEKTAPLTGQVDSIVQQNLHHIFSHDQFRRSEATWRGLRFLVKQAPAEGPVRIRIVPVSFDTMEETLEELLEKLAYDLPSLIMVDLGFDTSARCHDLLEKIALFSETLLVPCLTWITPKFFHLDTWNELNRLPYLPNYMDEMSFAKWRTLRGKSAARWVSLSCNGFSTRYPYGPDNPTRLVQFVEGKPLWIAPVWAAGALMVQSLSKCGWPTRFTAFSEVFLEDLPLHTDGTGKSLSTEIFITDDRADQIIRCGIMPLTGPYNADIACMPLEATAGDASLSYQLFVSIISRFILWCRDHFGGEMTPMELEDTLKKAFSLFWQRSSQAEPEELEIAATKTGEDERVLVSLSIKPSRKVLPSADRVNMEFYW